jgi:hypothetical protein
MSQEEDSEQESEQEQEEQCGTLQYLRQARKVGKTLLIWMKLIAQLMALVS